MSKCLTALVECSAQAATCATTSPASRRTSTTRRSANRTASQKAAGEKHVLSMLLDLQHGLRPMLERRTANHYGACLTTACESRYSGIYLQIETMSTPESDAFRL